VNRGAARHARAGRGHKLRRQHFSRKEGTMRTTCIASFLGAMTVAAGTWMVAAPPRSRPTVRKGRKAAGLHKKAAKEACGEPAPRHRQMRRADRGEGQGAGKDDKGQAEEICKSAVWRR